VAEGIIAPLAEGLAPEAPPPPGAAVLEPNEETVLVDEPLVLAEPPELEPPHAASVPSNAHKAHNAPPRNTCIIITSPINTTCCDRSFIALSIGGNLSAHRDVSQNRDR
jgi:hypothetical protein